MNFDDVNELEQFSVYSVGKAIGNNLDNLDIKKYLGSFYAKGEF